MPFPQSKFFLSFFTTHSGTSITKDTYWINRKPYSILSRANRLSPINHTQPYSLTTRNPDLSHPFPYQSAHHSNGSIQLGPAQHWHNDFAGTALLSLRPSSKDEESRSSEGICFFGTNGRHSSHFEASSGAPSQDFQAVDAS